MDEALERLAKKWQGRRQPKAFYLGSADLEEFMATNPPWGDTYWNRAPAHEPTHQGHPVRAAKNVSPRRSKLYDHCSIHYDLPESDPSYARTKPSLEIDYAAVEEKLTEISRNRALTDAESWLLERAIKRMAITLRECARLGVGRLSKAGL